MSSSTGRRPSRQAKLNAGDKIKDQMNHLRLLTSGKAYLDDDNHNDDNRNDDNDNEGENDKEAVVRPERRRRRSADDLSDAKHATTNDVTSPTTNTDMSKKTRSRSKEKKEENNEAVGAESPVSAEVVVERKPGRPKRQPTIDLDTTDHIDPAEESKKKPGQPKKQKAGDGDGDGTADQDESSIPAVEPKRKPGRSKRQKTVDDAGGEAGNTEPLVPTEESKKTLGRAKEQKTDDGDEGEVGGAESSMPAEETRMGPGRPKRQKTDDSDDTADHTKLSVLTGKPNKKPGQVMRQKEGDNEEDETGLESSIPTEVSRKKPGRSQKQKIVAADGEVDHTEPPTPTDGFKKRHEQPNKQKMDDDRETEAEYSKSVILTDEVRKKSARPIKLEATGNDDRAKRDESSTEEPNKKTGRPKRQRTDQESTDHVEASMSAEPKRRQRRSRKRAEDVSDSDNTELSTTRRGAKSREGRVRKQRQQHWSVNDTQGNLSESDYRLDSASESGLNSEKDVPKYARSRTGELEKGESENKSKDGAEEPDVQKRMKKPTVRELARMARVARIQKRDRKIQEKQDAKTARDRRKQEERDAKAAVKAKAKARAEAEKRKRARRSFLAMPVSVQLAHAVEKMAFQEKQHQPDEKVEYPALNGHNLAYQVLKRVRKDLTYRWPIREELLHSIPKSSFASTADNLDDFEEHGLGFVEELAGVPKKEEDYSDTDTEDDSAEFDEHVQETSGREVDEGDQSAEESAKEKELRRKRENHASYARNKPLKDILEREELAPRGRSERHQDERLANARLEAIQALFDGEVARFAQIQYQKGIPERIQDLDQFQESTFSRPCHQAVRTPIGSELSGFDQLDDLTRLQQRAIAFSAEDAVRKTLDRMTYVVRQGSLLRMPVYPVGRDALLRNKYERGWDTVMTSAALAGIDDRILKKVSMRMQNLLSKSKNIHHYEADSEGGWMTVEDAINKAKNPSSIPPQKNAQFVDPMDPDFDPRVSAKHRRKESHVPAADVYPQPRKDQEMVSTSRSGSVLSGSTSGSGTGTDSSSEGSASEGGNGSEGSHRSSDSEDDDGSG
ncbi:hypothetical protein BG015_000127 [Linnemannia schmuckeri]|uniref:Uncharacterized protein n=1 Tax=Linnemannia schmuckeri TaxID=64567 RepID=A0A9P5V7C0_9FUNG|nr:hypothetical protein BG015_000127 [Linnemannia schmuckeri]